MKPRAKLAASRHYDARLEAVGTRLNEVRRLLALHATRQSQKPEDWSFAGEMSHIEERLRELAEFLGASVGQTAETVAAFSEPR